MRKIVAICLITFVSFSTSHCKKTDIETPSMTIKSPVGTWIIIKAGRWITDGVSGKWVWDNVQPAEAFKVTFGDDNTFMSQEQTPPVNGTYTYSDGNIAVKNLMNLPTDNCSGKKMVGTLENNLITLKFLVGADASAGYQFKPFEK